MTAARLRAHLMAMEEADASLRIVRVVGNFPDECLRLNYSTAAVVAGPVDAYVTADGKTVNV